MPVAIVTGGSRGIGKAIALRLAKDGFSVVVNDIDRQAEAVDETVSMINDLGHIAHGILCDVSNKEQVEMLVDQTVLKFGELNIMIANAGILETAPLLDITVDKWDRTFAVNTRGVFLCWQIAAKQMIKQGKGGKLIAACSISGYRPSGKAPAYCSSKWAVRGLTQTAALEFGQYGITCNSYCPGSVKTDMSLVFAERLAKERGLGDVHEVYKNSSHRNNALGHELFPEDIAGLVRFLASKDSNGMTGQSIICDGGIYFS